MPGSALTPEVDRRSASPRPNISHESSYINFLSVKVHLVPQSKGTISSLDADGGFSVSEVEVLDGPYTNATILMKHP